MRNTLHAAQAAGAARIVLVSSVCPFGVPVFEAHAKGEIARMILRLPDFYKPGAMMSPADLVFQVSAQGRTANWLGPAGTPHEFVYAPDTAPALAGLAGAENRDGRA